MKALKPFVPSLYSEYLLTAPSGHGHQNDTTNNLVPTDGDKAAEGEGDLRGPGGDGKGTYEKGLGEVFGFPGDARKMRERSKMKLWREYFMGASRSHRATKRGILTTVHGRNLTRGLHLLKLLQSLHTHLSIAVPALPAPPTSRPPLPPSWRIMGSDVGIDLSPFRQSQDLPAPSRDEQGQVVAIDRRD